MWYKHPAEASPHFKSDFDIIGKIAEEHGTKYVIAIEYLWNHRGEIVSNGRRLEEHDVKNIVPLSGAFKEKMKGMPIREMFVDNCHFSEKGTKIIASEVFKYLTAYCAEIFNSG